MSGCLWVFVGVCGCVGMCGCVCVYFVCVCVCVYGSPLSFIFILAELLDMLVVLVYLEKYPKWWFQALSRAWNQHLTNLN